MSSVTNPEVSVQLMLEDALDLDSILDQIDPDALVIRTGRCLDSVFAKSAIFWGNLGFAVVPGHSKVPATAFGRFSETLPSPDQVEGWAETYPDAIPLLLPDSGQLVRFTVVDADIDDPKMTAWIEETFGKTPLTVATGRGRHHYYRSPDGVRVTGRNREIGADWMVSWGYELDENGKPVGKAKSWGKTCVDVKSKGNVVVAPGSPHKSGKTYEPSVPLESLTLAWITSNVPEFSIETYDRLVRESVTRRMAHQQDVYKVLGMPPSPVGTGGTGGTVAVSADLDHEPFVRWCQDCHSEVNLQTWFGLATNLAAVYGEDGRAEFQRISAMDERYSKDETDKTYTKALGSLSTFGPATYETLRAAGYGGEIPDGYKAPAAFLRVLDAVTVLAANWNDEDPELLAGVDFAEPAAPAASPAPARDPVKEHDDLLKLTDQGNAKLLVERHGINLRFCDDWNQWLVYSERTGVWQPDVNNTHICQHAKDVSVALKDEAVTLTRQAKDNPDNKVKEKLYKKANKTLKWAQKSAGKRAVVDAAFLARSEPGMAVRHEALDAMPDHLAVSNGVVDLRTGMLLPQDRKYLLTKQSGVVYDPAATCPTWARFLGEVFGNDQAVIDYVQRAVGYSLTGLTREQNMFILWGSGRNGKGTITQTLAKVLGPWSTPAANTMLVEQRFEGHPVDKADLCGRRLVLVNETKDGQKLAENKVKELTGGDSIWARKIAGHPFSFSPSFKIWLSTNSRPKITGRDVAIWSRIHLIPFEISFAGREDKTLGDKLTAELSGILAWAVRGAVRWYAVGLQPPKKVWDAIEKYKADEDTVGGYLADNVATGAAFCVPVGDIYKRYLSWAEDAREFPLKKKQFSAQMQERGHKVERGTNNVWVMRGLKLVDKPADAHNNPLSVVAPEIPPDEVDLILDGGTGPVFRFGDET